jgi:hypothetical protein
MSRIDSFHTGSSPSQRTILLAVPPRKTSSLNWFGLISHLVQPTSTGLYHQVYRFELEGCRSRSVRRGGSRLEKVGTGIEARVKTHQRQPISTRHIEVILHSNPKRRCEEKDSLLFPSKPGLRLREDIPATDPSPLPSLHPSSRRCSRVQPSSRKQDSSREARNRIGKSKFTSRASASATRLDPPQRAWYQWESTPGTMQSSVPPSIPSSFLVVARSPPIPFHPLLTGPAVQHASLNPNPDLTRIDCNHASDRMKWVGR